MTTAYFTAVEGHYAIMVEGHADFDATGRDIVCAACSMLSQALVQTLLDMLGEGVKWEIVLGGLCAECCPDAENEKEVKTAFDFARTGFEMLERAYPAHVRCKSGEN